MTTRDDTGPISMLDQKARILPLPVLCRSPDRLKAGRTIQWLDTSPFHSKIGARPLDEYVLVADSWTAEPIDDANLMLQGAFDWPSHRSLPEAKSLTLKAAAQTLALQGYEVEYSIDGRTIRIKCHADRLRGQLVVAAQPAIVDRVREALASSQVDWRTPASLADQLEVSETEVRKALDSLGSDVRQPIAARGDEVDYFRLADRGTTWQEKLRWLLLAIGRTPAAKFQR